MKEEVKKEIIYDLAKTLEILKQKEEGDYEELQVLSDHAIEDVALHKDLDLISVTVLIYSLYKTVRCLQEQDYERLFKIMNLAKENLTSGKLGSYNRNIKDLFVIVRSCNAKVKEHLSDVMHAARVKKGTVLLDKGLSIGQAAGLMGISNWDLQVYASKTKVLSGHKEKIPAKKRMSVAFDLFEVSS